MSTTSESGPIVSRRHSSSSARGTDSASGSPTASEIVLALPPPGVLARRVASASRLPAG